MNAGWISLVLAFLQPAALPRFLPPITSQTIMDLRGYTVEGNTAWWQISPRSGLIYMHRLDKQTRERTLSRYWQRDAARELIEDGVVRGVPRIWIDEYHQLHIEPASIRVVENPPGWDAWPPYPMDAMQFTVRPLSAEGKPDPYPSLVERADPYMGMISSEPEPDIGGLPDETIE